MEKDLEIRTEYRKLMNLAMRSIKVSVGLYKGREGYFFPLIDATSVNAFPRIDHVVALSERC